MVDRVGLICYNYYIASKERIMFKKLIVSIVILAISTGAVARDITVTFSDGSQHEYNNTPDNVTPAQVKDRAERDFPNRRLVQIAGTETEQGAKISDEQFIDKWGVLAYVLVGVVVVGAIVYAGPLIAAASGGSGGCNVPSDRAKDGSRCGNRAASVRPGGR